MKLVKLTIEVERSTPPIQVLFNPNQITISRTAWHNSKDGELAPINAPATLSMDLFFDTSLPQPATGGLASIALTTLVGRSTLPSLGLPQDVRDYTKRIYNLTQQRGDLGDATRPPMCELKWGDPSKTFFRGVLKSVTQTFTRFLENGTPVRATLKCEFEEWESSATQEKAKNPIDDPIRVVKRGETLSSIAAEEYGDAALWRVIADANRGLIQNPRQLAPGTALTVPPLQPTQDTQRR
jgi:phage tail protein X